MRISKAKQGPRYSITQARQIFLSLFKGRTFFIAECKFWKGAKSLLETVDQILGYLGWRDTKCAILLFNRKRNFTQVLNQVLPTIEEHPHFVTFEGRRNETEFSFTFRRPDDVDRRLSLTVLAFDIPGAQ